MYSTSNKFYPPQKCIQINKINREFFNIKHYVKCNLFEGKLIIKLLRRFKIRLFTCIIKFKKIKSNVEK